VVEYQHSQTRWGGLDRSHQTWHESRIDGACLMSCCRGFLDVVRRQQHAEDGSDHQGMEGWRVWSAKCYRPRLLRTMFSRELMWSRRLMSNGLLCEYAKDLQLECPVRRFWIFGSKSRQVLGDRGRRPLFQSCSR
jgi:hypothetical protein